MEKAETVYGKHPRFAQFTLDFTFKKAFAENEKSEYLLIFLLNVFLKEKLKSPIEEVSILDKEMLGETRFSRGAVFDIYCKDASGVRMRDYYGQGSFFLEERA